MSVWTKDYSQSDGVQVAYQSIGSGGGVQQVIANTVDYGASDTPMKDSELTAAKGGPILHIPLNLGAVVPTYNLKGVKTGLKFDGDTLGKIYAHAITSGTTRHSSRSTPESRRCPTSRSRWRTAPTARARRRCGRTF